jgi:Ca-activated chloride channel family protein
MMNSEICAELKGEGTLQPVFEGLHVMAELRETLAVTTITQSYRNAGSKNIEAVYTFPLPLDAVLLEMTVTLGDNTLKGTVLPKQEAEERYEEAITDGDAPVMLQNPQPGVYTMNVGNLLPGEKAQIMISYGIFMRWQGDTLRYHLPTTIAPRYGSAESAGIELHQEPETSLLVDNFYSFEMKVCGTMAGMAIESPSHTIAVERDSSDGESSIRLVRKSAFMDRDLIITVRNDRKAAATAMIERDGDEYLLWGSFQPRFGLPEDPAPRSIKIVVDCSGSMGGDSIAQAREALLRVLDELRPQDWFNIITFGSTATPLFNAQTHADRESLSYARGFLQKMDADMGGTEIGAALEMAVRLRCPEKIQQDVLLITDGEIWEWEKVVAKAVKSKHRFFTVGVGSAVSEAFVRTLAERTAGACELVSPSENMAERIHRHFKRIGTACSDNNEITWPIAPLRAFPEKLPPVYDGDTINLFAWFTEPPAGAVSLKVSLPDGTTQVFDAAVPNSAQHAESAIVSRMAAALRLWEMTDSRVGQELAITYQLVSRWTNYLAVVERGEGEKPDTLPELHKVQQMLAAGYGGVGRVAYCISGSSVSDLSWNYDSAKFSLARPSASDRSDTLSFKRKHTFAGPPPVSSSSPMYSIKQPEEPCSSFRDDDEWMWENPENDIDGFMEYLETMLITDGVPETIHLPLLPAGIRRELVILVKDGIDEKTVVMVFLHVLAASAAGSKLSRQAKRVISKAFKTLKVDSQTVEIVSDRLKAEMIEAVYDADQYDIPTFLRKGASIAAVP